MKSTYCIIAHCYCDFPDLVIRQARHVDFLPIVYSGQTDRLPIVNSGCPVPHQQCEANARFRTLDGSCNNLANPNLGKSFTAQTRIVPNAYSDGLGSPRSHGCDNVPLPGPREVSNMMHAADTEMLFEQHLTGMVMQVGQFLAHDLILTEMFKRPNQDPLKCCDADISNVNCFNIRLPANDPFFMANGCMPLPRSIAENDCNNVRQQINSQTSYLDLSVNYGRTLAESNILRSFSGGDARVNEQPGLASMHNLWFLEHNRIARGLARVNPQWNDERLFQEARKITIAEWQNIVYGEYIPILLGPDTMKKFKLSLHDRSYRDTYNPSVDASIINGFGVAVMRYGHTLIHRNISMVDTNMGSMMTPDDLSNHFFKVGLYHSHDDKGYKHMLRWISTERLPLFDGKVEQSVQRFLFKDRQADSFDLVALNIQRSREHGVPGYNAYRAVCGLKIASHFGAGPGGLVDHDPKVADRLSRVYRCPGDIDLFTGYLTERRTRGGLLGPLGQCLMGMQFKRLRDGDRFFFERNDPLVGFTREQLANIKQIRMSNIMCENNENTVIQPRVFFRPTVRRGPNPMVSCSRLPKLNLDLWRE
ncbi:peroxidase-like [Dreissena polymorpha]|uniref:peroxidase-like n=1 Tax=Dreissena polymorpha TaxID=45954 RepID=UPI0022648B37|nr:peroxidase-like [Dreissena polymorpha]